MLSAELKKHALQKILENAPKLFFISTLYVAAITTLGVIRFTLPGAAHAWEQFLVRLSAGELPGLGVLISNFSTVGLVLFFVIGIVTPVLSAGFMSYCLKINRNQDTDYTNLFEGFLLFIEIILISLIVFVKVTLWSLLFIIPGIVAAYKYRQVYYILLDDSEKDAFQCIRESELLMQGNKLELFLLDVSFLGWIILNGLIMMVIFFVFPFALPIVSLFLIPYRGLARAAFYEKIVKEAVI